MRDLPCEDPKGCPAANCSTPKTRRPRRAASSSTALPMAPNPTMTRSYGIVVLSVARPASALSAMMRRMTTATLTPDIAGRFARIALGHVSREYPNRLDHTMSGAADVLEPHVLHPIFYGSFDWHSCVNSYWMLARVARRFPE